MSRILLVYSCRHRLRASQRDNLLAFGKYPGHDWYYFNAALRRVPDYLLRVRWDLVIFHWQFMGARGVSEAERARFEQVLDNVRPLAQMDAPKAVMPQDEFLRMDLVDQVIREFYVTHVFPVAPPEVWPICYPHVDRTRVCFERVLTGYLDPDVVARVAGRASNPGPRQIDIGYRAGTMATWGRINLLKQQIADRVIAACAGRPFTLDIRSGWQHFLLGDAWYDFLLRCRWILGVEGGASLFDWDGSLWARMDAYTRQHPGATYDEIEAACFPGREGEIDLRALSPRHLEACATRTGQALIEGDYNGILRPNDHYVPIRRDFSNLDEVLDRLADEPERMRMTEAAYEEIVRPGHYDYPKLVQTVLHATLGPAADAASRPALGAASRPATDAVPRPATVDERIAWARNEAAEALAWQKIRWYLRLMDLRNGVRAQQARLGRLLRPRLTRI